MRNVLFALLAVVSWAGAVQAGPPIANPNYNVYTGRYSPVGAKNPITGGPLSTPRFSPVVGSVTRTGSHTNPFTHLAKYKGSALDPNTGRVYHYEFRK